MTLMNAIMKMKNGIFPKILLAVLLVAPVSSLFAKNNPLSLPYIEISDFRDNAAIVKTPQGKQGIIDTTGKILVPTQFDSIIRNKSNVYLGITYENGEEYNKHLYINGAKAEAEPLQAKPKVPQSSIFYNKNKQGIVDSKGNIVVPATYPELKRYRNGMIGFRSDDYNEYLWGLLDQNGNQILPAKYQYISNTDLSDKLLKVTLTKYGYINLQGKEVVPPKYDVPNEVAGLARLTLNGYSIFVNADLKTVLPANAYDEIMFARDGMIFVKKNRQQGTIRSDGSVAIPVVFKEIRFYQNNQVYIATAPDDKLAIYTAQGKEIAPPVYDQIEFLSSAPYIIVKQGNNSDLMDYSGQRLGLSQYAYFDDGSHENSIIVGDINHQLGMVDKTGKRLIQCQYDKIEVFNDNVFVVEKDDLKGVVDRQGNAITPIQYTQVGILSSGLIKVYQDNYHWSFINTKGETVIEQEQ